MTENKMKEVAKLLGVELEEEFTIKGCSYKYKLSKEGLRFWFLHSQDWVLSSKIGELLTGESQIIKLPKPILTEEEREYLSAVIKPFRNGVLAITKYNYSNGDEYLQIEVNLPNRYEYIKLPYFEKGTRYKGMKLGFLYILEELGL